MGSIAQSEASQVYSDYEQHSSGLMRSTDVVISSSLHKHHPDLTLAVTSTSTCDLLGFADAGFATAGLDSSSGTFSALRSYKPPATQLYGAEGTLENEIHFAKYDYRWFEYDFLVYMVVGYREPMCASRNTYILHRPQGNETVHSQSAVTDELITAVSQWTVELHNEVAVFDMGTWGKSRELWKSVQDASWDDVILDDETKKSLINDVEGFFNARDSYKKYAVPWKASPFFVRGRAIKYSNIL
ncbi:hypothetical protein MMC24_006866 [Lignoscripta atroalba]|nr:hypothetical protein [Lignoscripta atroalba]